jgi:hypothetical protein
MAPMNLQFSTIEVFAIFGNAYLLSGDSYCPKEPLPMTRVIMEINNNSLFNFLFLPLLHNELKDHLMNHLGALFRLLTGNKKPHLFLRNGVYLNFQTMQPPGYPLG